MDSSPTPSPESPQRPAAPHRAPGFDPDEYRMTVGEHLEELRIRMIRGLLGFAVAAIVCLIYGKQVINLFCRPLTDALQKYNLPPQLASDQVPDVFMAYMEISLITAAAIAGPWMLYQLWQFVAAGLYPQERKYITRYIPLSIGLLIGGMGFVYFLVLPWTLEFFIAFSISVPLDAGRVAPPPALEPATTQTVTALGPRTQVQVVQGDPADLSPGRIWYDATLKRMKIYLGDEVRSIPFYSENLIATQYRLPDYIDLVLGMLLTFGLSFQLPLVVLALVRIGILEIAQLKAWRKYVYFAMVVLAAAITPGDVITATVALMIPLCLLYELGIFLAGMGRGEGDPRAGR